MQRGKTVLARGSRREWIAAAGSGSAIPRTQEARRLHGGQEAILSIAGGAS